MTQKSIVVVATVALLVLASAPAAAVSVGGFSFGDSGPTLEQAEYGTQGYPSYIVELENSSTSASALQQWANASEHRSVIALDNASKTATIAAPAYAVDAGLLDRLRSSATGLSVSALTTTQLADAGYVAAIHPNWQHSLTRPERLTSEQFTAPQEGRFAFDDPDFPTSGMAFSEDANTTPPDEVRQTVEADGITANGTGVTVAVVDTGTNTANGAVFGNGTSGSDIRISNASKSFISNETVASDGWGAITDKNGHGTWVSAAIAANYSNATYDAPASNATLLVLKALNSEGSGSTSDIAASIRYAADHDADIVSLSLGSPLYDAAIADSIRYAYANGVQAVVVAAGNSRTTLSPGLGSPADMPTVIAVGATNGSTNLNHSASAYFSQYSGYQSVDGNATNAEEVDVVAPGMQTLVKAPTADGFVSNSTKSGTSMATPYTASVLAESFSANATLASADHTTVHDAVTASANPLRNLATAEAGHGMVSARNLINGVHPEQSQADAMDDAASQRQAFYESLDSGNGLLARLGA